MNRIHYLLTAVFLVASAGPGLAADQKLAERVAAIDGRIDAELQNLLTLYKTIHRNPELSLQEEQTSARLAKELRALGFEVTEKVGGYGVVGLLKNGPGPTVLVRTDMDALPVTEATGLPYASKLRVRDKNGNEVGVMHACGHDMHMTVLDRHGTDSGGDEGQMVRHADVHRPAGRGDRRRGPPDARGRPVQEVPQARLLPGPALRPATPTWPHRFHRGAGSGQRRFRGHPG